MSGEARIPRPIMWIARTRAVPGFLICRQKFGLGPNMTGTLIEDWTTQFSTANTNNYTADWQISSQTFNKLQEAYTNNVSVRVFDAGGLIRQQDDAFYIKKDTTPPSIANNEASGIIPGAIRPSRPVIMWILMILLRICGQANTAFGARRARLAAS